MCSYMVWVLAVGFQHWHTGNLLSLTVSYVMAPNLKPQKKRSLIIALCTY